MIFLSASPLFLTACSSPLRLQSGAGQNETLQGQILLWVELPSTEAESQSKSIQQVVQSSLEGFNRLHPEVKIFVETFPLRQLQVTLQDQIQRGAGPDLLIMRAHPDLLDLIQARLLRTVDETELKAAQFRTEALKSVRYQDRVYGLPMFLTTQVLCYNKKKVERLPKTLADLIQQARKGYSVGLMSGFLPTYWGIGSFGGASVENPSHSNAEQWQAWSQWLGWLKAAQNEPNFILSDDTLALQQAFLNGQLAYLSCRSDWLSDFSQVLGQDTLGVTLLPGQSHQSASPIMETGIIAFNQASSSKQHRLALRLAQFLTNTEQQKRIEAAIPFIPSNKGVTINPQLFPTRATLIEQSKTALAISLDEMDQAEAVVNYGNILYQQALAGEISLNTAEAEIQAFIQQEFSREE